MTDSSQPLAILTLDGGALDAVSTLLALNEVLEEIAQENGLPRNEKPRPCDVFDTIAGTGAGGWLTILLGRFRLDIASCLSEWYDLVQDIKPRSRTEGLRLQLFQHCNFDKKRLVERIDVLNQTYDTGDRLFGHDPKGARTRHVFVAAPTPTAKGYNIFRSYNIPESAGKMLEGPEDPSNFKISRAFEVIGTGKWKFRGTKIPEPHNITELALDEMWGIYGNDVPLSVVLNIGPGLPNEVDLKRIARRFAWRPSATRAHEVGIAKILRSPHVPQPESDNVEQEFKRLSKYSHYDAAEQDPTNEPVVGKGQDGSVARMNLSRTLKAKGVDAKLTRREDEIEKDIKKKLDNNKPGDAELYYRISPAKSSQYTDRSNESNSA